jgi:hypothetical protein
VRRQQQAALVADYLARGGEIRRLPTPEPTAADDVFEYLRECGFDVSRARGKMAGTQYICNGRAVPLEELVSIANNHRETRRLPPFQLVYRMN